VLATLGALRVDLITLTRRVTTLEDVFLTIVGRRAHGSMPAATDWAIS
jgi:hypothetical protein